MAAACVPCDLQLEEKHRVQKYSAMPRINLRHGQLCTPDFHSRHVLQWFYHSSQSHTERLVLRIT